MLDSNIQTQLKAYFEKIVEPIVLTATLDDSSKSTEMLALLNQVAELSDKISLKNDGTNQQVPSFNVSKVDSDARVTFSGLPMGHGDLPNQAIVTGKQE